MSDMVLVTMRLKDAKMMHALQTLRACSKCKRDVVVYPTGQRALAQHPQMKILCQVCTKYRPGDEAVPAGPWREIWQEIHDSVERQ